jgi:hypothetical protein
VRLAGQFYPADPTTLSERLVRDKVASIVPVPHLSQIDGDRYMLVLSHVLADHDVLDWYSEQATLGAYIIVDSPVVEFGEPRPFEETVELAMAIHASEVLTPDWFQDADKTIQEAEKAVKTAKSMGYTGKLMVSPQGTSLEEWMACAQVALLLPIHTIGISYRYTSMFGNRLYAISRLSKYLTGRKVHLLGCLLDPKLETAKALVMPQVQGVDSAIAALFTKYHQRWVPWMERPPKRDIDFISDKYNDDLLAYNLEQWRLSCAGRLA